MFTYHSADSARRELADIERVIADNERQLAALAAKAAGMGHGAIEHKWVRDQRAFLDTLYRRRAIIRRELEKAEAREERTDHDHP